MGKGCEFLLWAGFVARAALHAIGGECVQVLADAKLFAVFASIVVVVLAVGLVRGRWPNRRYCDSRKVLVGDTSRLPLKYMADVVATDRRKTCSEVCLELKSIEVLTCFSYLRVRGADLCRLFPLCLR